MLVISFLIVAVFMWLVFNNPLTNEKVHDTYESFFEEIQQNNRKGV